MALPAGDTHDRPPGSESAFPKCLEDPQRTAGSLDGRTPRPKKFDGRGGTDSFWSTGEICAEVSVFFEGELEEGSEGEVSFLALV